MGYGPTIRQKKGPCSHPGCRYIGALTKGKCQTHYWNDIRMKSLARLEEKESSSREGLSTVEEDLDTIFSRFIRLRDCDENGYISCYCCGAVYYWTECECMHFVPRIHKNTRYSEDNCHGGCSTCNGPVMRGNLKAYGEHLEKDRAGTVEGLEEQARAPYKYDIPELKELIAYYSKEVKKMKNLKPLKS